MFIRLQAMIFPLAGHLVVRISAHMYNHRTEYLRLAAGVRSLLKLASGAVANDA